MHTSKFANVKFGKHFEVKAHSHLELGKYFALLSHPSLLMDDCGLSLWFPAFQDSLIVLQEILIEDEGGFHIL